MTSRRSLNRNLTNICHRIIKADEQGMDPDPEDLQALRTVVRLLIENLKAKP
jgi:hypothetical protein